MVCIVDYGAGNLQSVINGLTALGVPCETTSKGERLQSASALILPGVGSFGAAMKNLTQRKLDLAVKDYISSNRPFLGICLGLQVLFESSEESPGVKGLGIFDGKILKIPTLGQLKIPHIGWNSLDIKRPSPLLAGVNQGDFMYFVHSFYLSAQDRSIVSATVDYGTELDIAITHQNLHAVQFHPEKSGDVGLIVLKNFVKL